MATDGLTVPERVALVHIDHTALQTELIDTQLRVLILANSQPGTEVHKQLKLPRMINPTPEPVEPERRAVSLTEAFGMVETMMEP